jgi:3-oxoacyl-[acyl-carrier protein] reductase
MAAPAPRFDPHRLGPPAGARVAVVGGCGGMGRTVVSALARTGVSVAVLDLPASLAEHPPAPEILAVPVDAADASAVEQAFATLASHWPALDGFVNLAGFMKHWQPLDRLTPDQFDEVFAGNARGQFLCARAALPLLRGASDAAMVLVASTLGLDVHKGYVHYAAAKAAIIAMTKGLARENAPRIRVNALAPGITRTAFLTGGTGRPQAFDTFDPEAYARRVPLGRVAEPEDMAGPILFLLGPAAAYMTGETLIVDGGVYQE